MPIKLAFSTVACPQWTLEDVARKAQELGYAGVELRTFGPDSSQLAGDPALSTPAKVASVFKAFGIEPICLSTSVSIRHSGTSEQRANQIAAARAIDFAAEVGCPAVRLFAHDVAPGQTSDGAMRSIAEQALPLVERAGDAGVQLLFENAGSFSRAKQWWWLFNLINHPMLGMVWNVANAAAAGESVAVSLPTLHSRIRIAKAKDLRVGEGSGFTQLGDGTVGIDKMVKRLLGIGFDGYISVEWDRLWLPVLEPAETFLPEAAKRLKDWMAAIASEIEVAQASAAKAAAKVKLTPGAAVRV
jgi:sugar phosphate isomerase/epimerase